jgi:hypothetical protein
LGSSCRPAPPHGASGTLWQGPDAEQQPNQRRLKEVQFTSRREAFGGGRPEDVGMHHGEIETWQELVYEQLRSNYTRMDLSRRLLRRHTH